MTTTPSGEQNSAYDLLFLRAFLVCPVAVRMSLAAKKAWRWMFAALLVAAPVSLARAEEAVIDGFHMERVGGLVSISFDVENCFSTKMEEAIEAGVPTTFNFFVRLHRKRYITVDKRIVRHKFKHTIAYDNIQKDFRVSCEETGKEIRAKTLDEAKTHMARVESFPVVAERLLKEGNYRLSVKAELDPVKLPLRMEYIFFFVSLWDFETEWYRHNFKVLP